MEESKQSLPVKRRRVSRSRSRSPSPASGSGRGTAKNVDPRPKCEYGAKCYRVNPDHLRELHHPHLEDILHEMESTGNYSQLPAHFANSGIDSRKLLEQVTVVRKYKNNHPSSSSSSTSTSSSSNPYHEAIEDVREKRKQQFLESKKTKTQLPEVSGSPTSEVKATEKPRTSTASSSSSSSHSRRRSMKDVWEASCPYNFFLTKVSGISEESEGIFSVSFSDLFDPSLGEVKAVVHINFMMEPDWLLEQTMRTQLKGKPTRLLFDGDSKELQGVSDAFSWIKVFGVKSPFPYGHHHTKMSIVQYTDHSVRFFIYTANLIESDWDTRTQGVWISPRCPKIDSTSSNQKGDSVTKFKRDIMEYLSTYQVQATRAWIDEIKNVDCSGIRVYFVASAPTSAKSATSGFEWGLCKMAKILKSVDLDTDPLWPLIIQCSSIGTLGKGVEDWVQSELAKAFSGKDRLQKGPISVIYPSHNNVKNSFDGLRGGGCLPYSASTHVKQPWLERHLCQWRADRSRRSRAPPHIKSYLRMSPDNSQLAWFLLTSANLSKAAWGKLSKNNDRLSVMSWEAGVLFVPQILISKSHFSVSQPGERNTASSQNFPLHIDIPVTKYDKEDKPWFMDTLHALILQEGLNGNRE